MMNSTWRATWQPAALVTSDIITLKLALAVAAFVRAEDYAHSVADRFGVLEAAAPIWVWSVWSATVGALILSGIAWRIHRVVWLGHALGAALYTLLALAGLGEAFADWPGDTEPSATVPWAVWSVILITSAGSCVVAAVRAAPAWRPMAYGVAAIAVGLFVVNIAAAGHSADGIRAVGPLAVIAILHALLATRSGTRPIPDADTDTLHVVMVEGITATKDGPR